MPPPPPHHQPNSQTGHAPAPGPAPAAERGALGRIALPPGVRLTRVTSDLHLAAARRLVSTSNADIDQAARRLVTNASSQGIDLGLAWASVDTAYARLRVRQVCLPVLGAGRTVMCFLSEPPRAGDFDGGQAAAFERAGAIEAALATLGQERAGKVAIAQALPSPEEGWSRSAFELAGFTSVGNLYYMRRNPGAEPTAWASLPMGDPMNLPDPKHAWPEGLEVVTALSLPASVRDATLIRAMDASYVETLDCPELCGLRSTEDILASHKAAGAFDASTWWIARRRNAPPDEAPAACAFFSPCPEQRSVELVYLGVAQAWRGKGLGRKLLRLGLATAAKLHAGWSVACAVDERNGPALALYERAGFRAFARRIALVKAITTSGNASGA